MKNKKGLELALSTVIVVVIVILVLVGIVYVLTNGFQSFRKVTTPYLESNEALAVKQACTLSCQNQDKVSFCKSYDWTDNAGKATQLNCPEVYTVYDLQACSAISCT